MKKISALVFGSVLLFSLQTGTAMASNTLDESVKDLLGTPYKWGGTSKQGFDCSGFIITVFSEFNIELPRTSKSQAQVGEKVSRDELRPGDLVFFNIDGKGISHAGIYVGDGKFAHSASNKGVSISNLNESYYAKRFVTARRVTSEAEYVHMITNPGEAE